MIIRIFNHFLLRFAPIFTLVLLIATAPARAEFMGGGYLTDYQNCARYGWPVNTEMLRARYSASELDGGPSELVMTFAVGGINTYTLNRALVPARAWRPAQGQVTWGTTNTMGTRPRLRVLERETVPFVGGHFGEYAEHIRLRVRIQHFNGMQGCTVTAVMMLNNWTNAINRH